MDPIFDGESPTLTGGIYRAMDLCDVLEILFRIDGAFKKYNRGWGCEGFDLRPITAFWTLLVQDVENKFTSLAFDRTADDSPLIIGLYLQKYSTKNYVRDLGWVEITSKSETVCNRLKIYITCDHPLQLRAYVDTYCVSDLILMLYPSLSTVLATIYSLSKRVHQYSHVPSAEMATSLGKRGLTGDKLKQVCSEIVNACDLCPRTDLPLPSWKISLLSISEAFNEEIKVDFMVTDIRYTKYCVLHIVDTGTSYLKTGIVSKR